MLPTFLIIGTQKGGTTSLYEYMVEHPDVGRAATKEINYFTHNADRPLTWYRAHFPRIGTYPHSCEGTPTYISHPRCPERIHAVLADAKFVLLLRDPFARAYSHYNMEVQLGREPRDFATALAQEAELLPGGDERILGQPRYAMQSYLARSMYANQLERWYAYFPREQMLVLASEKLFSDPAGTVRRVQEWLGLAPHVPAHLAPVGARTYESVMDADCRAMMAEWFLPDIARVRQLTDAELPWA